MSELPQAIYYYRDKLLLDTLDTNSPTGLIYVQSLAIGYSRTYVVGQVSAQFRPPRGVAVDSSGNIFVADSSNHRIRKITPDGLVTTTLAGSGSQAFADGTGTGASFNSPYGVAVDASGNVFVADRNNHCIRKVTPGGVVSTFAGSGQTGNVDATGLFASFNSPYGVAVDASGNIFVADTSNHRIRKITPDGLVTTLAGSGSPAFADAPSGPGDTASFNSPYGVAVDASGNVFVADRNNHRIRKVTPGGAVTTLAGSGSNASANGTGAGASFSYPEGVAVDSIGNVYVYQFTRIRKLTPPSGLTWDSSGAFIDSSGNGGGIVTTFVGDGMGTFINDGTTASTLGLTYTGGMAVDASDNLIIPDPGSSRIRKATPGGVVTVFAGSSVGYRDSELPSINWNIGWSSTGNKTKANQVTVTNGTSLDASGTYFLYPSGSGNAMYYFASQADASGCLIDTYPNIAATVTKSLGVSRNYTVGNLDAMFSFPSAMAVDSNGNIFVTDEGGYRIRKVTPGGVVTTLAGSGEYGSADGTGTGAAFSNFRGVAVDPSGNVFVADYSNHRIRKVTPGGVVTTLAGNALGFADGTGTSASFNYPRGGGVDSSGNFFVADEGNHRIRKVTPGGVVTTLAGNGTPAFADGTGAGASFSLPKNVAVDSSGNVFVGDIRIRKVTPDGVVTTLAGNGTSGFADGTGAGARFRGLFGLAIDASGNIFAAESNSHSIRKIAVPSGLTWDSPGSFIDSSGNGGGIVTTVAGTGLDTFVVSPSGPGSAASFYNPRAVAVDASGNLLVADSGNHRILKINISTGAVTTLAGAQAGYKDNNITLPSSQWKIASNSPGLVTTNVTASGNTIINPHGTYFLYPSAVCFLEGTTVLCFVNGNEEYVPVEKLSKETLVKTLYDGFKKIDMIAKQELFNPGTDERMEQRLYKCSTSKYPELTSDLYLTGCHSILVDTITDDERVKLTKQLGRIFVTDTKYRLTACVDERAEPWNSEGTYTVWHFALDHENILMNYGVFVNGGLLVESCSKHVLKNKSDMVLL